MVNEQPRQFDDETWAQLTEILGKLPEPIRLHIWGDPAASPAEQEAARLAETLADRFPGISYQLFPRRENYPYYPVIGVMGLNTVGEAVDYGLRLVGLPAGYQMTSFITAIQAVAFRGMTSEAKTRIWLHRLAGDVTIEVVATAAVETAAQVAHPAFNMAVASAKVRTFLIMADAFPEILTRYSVRELPHTVLNGRIHLGGLIDEETLAKHVARAGSRPTG
jgi:alkyl hydroperoxide reductase subunit AhpF